MQKAQALWVLDSQGREATVVQGNVFPDMVLQGWHQRTLVSWLWLEGLEDKLGVHAGSRQHGDRDSSKSSGSHWDFRDKNGHMRDLTTELVSPSSWRIMKLHMA